MSTTLADAKHPLGAAALAGLVKEETRPTPMSNATLADVLYPLGSAGPAGAEPQSPPSDLTPNSPNGSSQGSVDGDGGSRKRSASGSIKEGKERTANKVCRVCGDKAYSYNFNVITCESCKAFFRRNANKEKEIRCPFNESCEINVVSRRFCQRCRLFKCFSVGMKKEWIMTDEARLEKKARVEENRERRREEAKRKDGDGYSHYRTTSVSSSNGGGSAKSSAVTSSAASAAAATAAAVAAAAETQAAVAQQQQARNAQLQQQHRQQQQQLQQQHQQQLQDLFQPELPTHATSTSTLLDALAQQVQQHQQQHQVVQPVSQPLQSFGSAAAAAALAAVGVPPVQTSNDLVAHAIALEQQMQQTPFGTTSQTVVQTPSAVADAVYQAAAAHHQQQQMAAAVAQQIVQMTTPVPQPQTLVDANAAAMAAALSTLPPVPQTPTTAATAAALSALSGASPLGPLTQAALIMDASAAATQQLLAAAAPPPPSALAAVASTMLLQPQQQLMAPPAAPAQSDRCCCTCSCGKYHGPRSIVDQAQDEWEAERRARRSSSSDDDLGLAELLPSASAVNWLNPARNQNPLTDGALTLPSSSEGYGELTGTDVGQRPIVDTEFGPMEADDELRLKNVHEANKVWLQPLPEEEAKLHQQNLPSKMDMLHMMVGAVKRMILMSKKFTTFTELKEIDRMKLYQNCYLDVMIIRGAMAYDPTVNAWKGPTSHHNYEIKMDAMIEGQENMMEQSVRLYAMFKEEYRSDETIMLLLNMIVLFDPTAPGLKDPDAVRTQQSLYKRCLKRIMYTKIMNSPNTDPELRTRFFVEREFKMLLDRLATVKKMNNGARGIMTEHADNIDPLLKELLGMDRDRSGKKHSPRGIGSVSSTASADEAPPSASSTRS